MKKYVVASINFFDNEIKQSIQESDNELNAFKQHMLSLCTTSGTVDSEIEWQNDEDYPKTYEELLNEISNWDMDCSITEIK